MLKVVLCVLLLSMLVIPVVTTSEGYHKDKSDIELISRYIATSEKSCFNEDSNNLSEDMGDQQDQKQTAASGGMIVGYVAKKRYQTVAQSFKPNLSMLTKVELKISRINGSGKFRVSNKEGSYDGEVLTHLERDDGDITNESSWIVFDFKNISVIPGSTYFIVCEVESGLSKYVWNFSYGNNYKRGKCYYFKSWEGVWREEIDADCCFVTYGIDNTPPTTPIIAGPTWGKFGKEYKYTFVSTDPDGDKVYYYIDWGDGKYTDWRGPYNSGKQVTLSHTWNENGTYTIRAKAKDVHDIGSEWGTLEISMPKTCSTVSLLQKLNEWFISLFEKTMPPSSLFSLF